MKNVIATTAITHVNQGLHDNLSIFVLAIHNIKLIIFCSRYHEP